MGAITKTENSTLSDLTKTEIGLVIPLVILFVWIGFQPNTFLKLTESSSRAVVGVIEKIQGENRYLPEANSRLGLAIEQPKEVNKNVTSNNSEKHQQQIIQKQIQEQIQKQGAKQK